MSKKSKLLAFSSILSLLANTHIAAVLRHAAEQIDHEFSVLQLRILPGGERTAHASGRAETAPTPRRVNAWMVRPIRVVGFVTSAARRAFIQAKPPAPILKARRGRPE